jgi:DNA-directed RNA polymerase II subunit RPB1
MTDAGDLITKNWNDANSIFVMSPNGSGARGSTINTGQMIGLLGQNVLEAKRIAKNIGERTLPYFFRNDDTAIARGFIQDSFLSGLAFPEYIIHHSTAREGLINTVIKTSETGYTQRKITKILEDVIVTYDHTLRTGVGGIVQFLYGDCGIDATHQYEYIIDMFNLSDADMAKRFQYTPDELKKFPGYTQNMSHLSDMMQYRDLLRHTQIKTKLDYKIFYSYSVFKIPINLNRLLEKAKMVKNEDAIVNPMYVLEQINQLLEHHNTSLICTPRKVSKDSIKCKDEIAAKTVLRVALYNALSPKRVTMEYPISKKTFDDIIRTSKMQFMKSLAEPGEMVGILTAQEFIQPLTQSTLNTFHQSGVGSKGHANLGINRIRELLSLTKQIKTPSMTIYLDQQFHADREMAHRIAAHLKQTTIIDVRNEIQVYYDPEPTKAGSFAEQDKVGKPFYVHSTGAVGCQANISDLPWLVRVTFDREKLLRKDVTMLDILSQFCQMWSARFHDTKHVSKEERAIFDKIIRCGITGNTDNDDVPVIHIRFDMNNFTIDTITHFVDIVIDNLKLKGFTNILEVHDPSADETRVIVDPVTHELKNDKEFIIYTSGVNMTDIRMINGIDTTRTMCNDVMQIYTIFGIEAARIALLREIGTTIGGSGASINYQHLSVLVDLMTRDGFMISIDRHGMGRTEMSPLGKISFEQPIELLLSAAIFNETDPMNGVSARIFAGNIIKGGTGMCDVMLDTDTIEHSEYVEDTHVARKQVVDDAESRVIRNILSSDHHDIFVPIDN